MAFKRSAVRSCLFPPTNRRNQRVSAVFLFPAKPRVLVQTIGGNALAFCSRLHSIRLLVGLSEISHGMFYCTGLKEIYILDTVISIETDAFTNCHSFKTINLTDGLTKICRNTFDGCISIKTITIPDTITKIAKETFSNY